MISLINLLIPSILFFGLGFLAHLIDSDLELSGKFIYYLSVYLVIGIGLHGGITLRNGDLSIALKSIIVGICLAIIQTFLAYYLLSSLGKFNASAIAAHYGSVSIGTFLTATAFLTDQNIAYESYPTLMLAVMEIPSIVIGITLAKIAQKQVAKQLQNSSYQTITCNKNALHKAFISGSIVLLIGSMIIGCVAQINSLKTIQPFFETMFNGVLCLFLIGMGIEAAKRINEVYKMGLFLIAFGILMPIIGSLMGIFFGHFVLGFGLGGTTLVAILGASASYIAAPPIIKMAIPEANPTLYLTLSLGITFPFNVTFGIPLYFKIAQLIIGN